MNIAQHKEKALRIERSLGKCGPEDVEIRIEAAMLAGTHWLNLALHAKGVTPEAQDVMHTYMLTVNEYRRLSAADAALIAALTEIEDLRPVNVRGDVAGSAEAADRAAALLAQIRSIALAAAGA